MHNNTPHMQTGITPLIKTQLPTFCGRVRRAMMTASLGLCVLTTLPATAGPLATHTTPDTQTVADAAAYTQSELRRAEQTVVTIINSITDLLNNKALSQQQKQKQFQAVLNSKFDMNTIGRFAMGRYWRTATQEQRKRYLALFNAMIVDTYSRRFSEYKGQIVRVDSSRSVGKRDAVITSYVDEKNKPKIKLDWRLRKDNNRFYVIDLVIEGASMALTQRSDFASVIQRGGGNVDVLLSHLAGRK